MNEPLLSVRSLRKVFGSRRSGDGLVAVDDVSFDLPQGGSLAIVGESGSGKTTTARIVAGLETATGGEILLDGRPIAGSRSRRGGHGIQMVFQDPFGSLDPRQKVGNAISEILAVRHTRAERRAQVLKLLSEVGLDERHAGEYPANLSGGQRQRVAIARALAQQPRVLILDEAVSALDVSVQAQVLNLLIDLRARLGISYLFVSHDLAVVRQVSDHCLVMQHGRVVEHGATGEVLDHPQDRYTRLLLDAVPRPGWTPRRRPSVSAV
ncbi:ABC-type glutathione transport system ATPase component [Kibdelosporangium banguiense]|uniref:ABC-type glutathione transport system ATPase component n=1 Tax=Kibdelosporangium banguiense TaxID=1365924 RepID=A0ABS4TPX8_9PSEU|nr:ATP-binding cassette domain-containing protein [Kibdelosporangium banguiense]MBP2326458.1 ABC-type glutathione transport system ATPase component [Kibdelosporangium banguiense]